MSDNKELIAFWNNQLGHYHWTAVESEHIQKTIAALEADKQGEPVALVPVDEFIAKHVNKFQENEKLRLAISQPDRKEIKRRDEVGEVLAAEGEFTKWFIANYPGPDTIIHNPLFHAPKIFSVAWANIRRARKEPIDRKEIEDEVIELAELKQAHADLFATSQEMNADLVALRAEIAAAKAQPQSPLHGMEDMIKAWYSRHYDNMRKHMPEYSEIELEAYLSTARMHYIEGFSDARLAHLMNEQSGKPPIKE